MKYEVSITAIGNLATAFLRNNRSIIIMNRDINPSVSDMVVTHTESALNEDIIVGDMLTLGHDKYKVISVGYNALKNLREQGHCTLVFNSIVEMPGQIALEGEFPPRLMIGDVLRFE